MSSTHEHILNYLEYLKKEHSLYITIHSVGDNLCCKYADYNVHLNPYCLYLKTNGDLWSECIRSQDEIVKRCAEGSWLGVCHAGVAEYVYPVMTEGVVKNFISVSGYRPAPDSALYSKAMHKLDKLCRRFELDPVQTKTAYEQHLKQDIPDKAFTDVIIEPLCDLLRLEYLEIGGQAGRVNGISRRDQLYYNVCNQIRGRHNQKIDLEGLCRDMHYSVSYISHMFKKRSGMTINQYVNLLRVEEARIMLDSTEMSVQDIAMTVGFSDANYFSSVFKSVTGVSPRAYRNDRRDKLSEKSADETTDDAGD